MVGLFFLKNDLLSINPNHQHKNDSFEKVKINLYTNEQYILENISLLKFPEDCLSVDNEQFALGTDGVILNSDLIFCESNVDERAQILFSHYQDGTLLDFLKQFRGSFSGVIYDKNNGKVCAYTDQFSTKTLFYFYTDYGIIISSEVSKVVATMKDLGISIELDEIGAYSLLSYGYMYRDHTLIKGVRRLREGSILMFFEGKVVVEQYYKFSFHEKKIDFNEAIDQLDKLFKRAVLLQHNKNKAHGYMDVVPLSAGMDCRMTSFVLSSISDDPILNFTYSETGQYDQVVPADMSREQNNRWLFKSLDNGLDLENIDEAIMISDGLIKYDWPAQLIDFIKLVNTKQWGIVHTGVIGDVIIGSYEKTPLYHRQYKIGDGAFSNKLIPKLNNIIHNAGEDPSFTFQEGMISNRGINGACLGYSRTFRLVSEDLSPFMNVDFAEFCFSLPMSYRRNHKIYYEWVRRKYPSAARFKHNGIRIDGKITFSYHGREYTFKSLPDIISNKIKRDIIKKGYGMNPQQTWYEENEELRTTMDNYFYTNIQCLKELKGIYEDTIQLYKSGTVVEKILAISFVGNYCRFFVRN